MFAIFRNYEGQFESFDSGTKIWQIKAEQTIP